MIMKQGRTQEAAEGGIRTVPNVSVREMICLEFRGGEETISDGGNASSVTRGGGSEGLCCPGPGRADMEGEGEARKWHDGQKSERVFQFALYHQYDCPDPDHDCPFLPPAVAESAYLPLLFLRGRRHSDASFRGINALLFARSPSPARRH